MPPKSRCASAATSSTSSKTVSQRVNPEGACPAFERPKPEPFTPLAGAQTAEHVVVTGPQMRVAASDQGQRPRRTGPDVRHWAGLGCGSRAARQKPRAETAAVATACVHNLPSQRFSSSPVLGALAYLWLGHLPRLRPRRRRHQGRAIGAGWRRSGVARRWRARLTLGDLSGRLAALRRRHGAPVFIRIFKREFELEVWLRKGDRFHLFATYPVCRWSGRLGPKLDEGDGQSPEGFYTVDRGALNPASRWHRSFNLGFPNVLDRAHGRTGSLLMVHGGCSSVGCFAMTDPGVDEIWRLVQAAHRAGQPRCARARVPVPHERGELAQRAREPLGGILARPESRPRRVRGNRPAAARSACAMGGMSWRHRPGRC